MEYSVKAIVPGWVGGLFRRPSKGEAATVQPHLYADADIAGCVGTLRSTSGVRLCLPGPRAPSPLAGLSERQ
eukprot:2814145-Alexandrium_andersonii.AAC.1